MNDEEYITRIVEIIQNNDLENKKENIRVRISRTRESEEKIELKDKKESFNVIE